MKAIPNLSDLPPDFLLQDHIEERILAEEEMLTKYHEPCEHGVTGPCALCDGPCPSCGAGPRDLHCARQPVTTVIGHSDTCAQCWATWPEEDEEPEEPDCPLMDWDQIEKDKRYD
jgi:hypothetical protein